MKKLILSLLAVGTIAAADAQSHTWLLYGDVGFHSTKDSAGNNTMNWHAQPGFGYQFNDMWTVGVNLGYAQQSEKDNGASDRLSINNYNAGAFLRYERPIMGVFSWYGQLNAGYMGGNTTFGSEPSFDKNTGFYVNVVPAVKAAIGHNMALTMNMGGLGYNTKKYDGAPNSTNSFDVTFGHDWVIGLQKNFGCGHHKMHHEPGDEMHHMDASDDNSDDAPKAKHHNKKKDKDEDE